MASSGLKGAFATVSVASSKGGSDTSLGPLSSPGVPDALGDDGTWHLSGRGVRADGGEFDAIGPPVAVRRLRRR